MISQPNIEHGLTVVEQQLEGVESQLFRAKDSVINAKQIIANQGEDRRLRHEIAATLAQVASVRLKLEIAAVELAKIVDGIDENVEAQQHKTNS